MATLNISLSEDIRSFIEQQVAAGRYHTPSDYLEALILADRREREQEHLEEQLLKGLQSPAAQMMPDEWTTIRKEGLQRLAVEQSG